MPKFISGALAYARTHTVVSSIAVVVVLGGGYWTYSKAHASSQPVRYVLGTVAKGTIISSVTGSGQVSASNQVDIKPKAGGEITSITVAEGQTVGAGAAIAYIDSTDAQKAVRDAQSSLDSANLALQKLQQPADALTVTQAQNAIAKAQETEQNANDDLSTAYDDSFTDVANAFTDLPTVITGLNTILYGFDSGLGGSGQWNVDFYGGKINMQHNDNSGTDLANDVKSQYTAAHTAYDKAFATYKATSRTSDTAALESMTQQTSDAVTAASSALKSMNNLIRAYEDTLGNGTAPSAATMQLTSINTYTSTINGHISTLRSALDTIKNSKQSISDSERTIGEDQAQLQKLQDGTDPLDLQSAQLTVQQRENALTDAKNTLTDYAIRAPFAGTIAKLDIHKGDTVSSGTAAATIVTKQQLAELSLNEVDAAKVKVGQKSTLTFDAIDGLSITGEVASIDTIGTVSQGVVTYTVKIGFDTQDSRVKTGMTVNASIITDLAQDALTVPSGAIKSQNGSSYVLVVDNPPADASPAGVVLDAAPRQVDVTTGISDDTDTQILSGLTEGQSIVVRTVSQTAGATAAAPSLFGGGGGARAGAGGAATRVQAR